MLEAKALYLRECVQNAGEIAMRFWRDDPQAWEKSNDQGPVSEADLAVNDYLTNALEEEYPEISILSEEAEDNPARLSSPLCWVVDPIDGTKAFLKGEKFFAISIALVENGRPVLGAIFAPALEEFYFAQKNAGAFCNDAPLSVSQNKEIAQARILASKAGDSRRVLEQSPPLKNVFRPSIALRMALAAKGQFDATMALRPSWEWDVAAGDLIVHEAGGKVSDSQGQLPLYNQARPQLNGIVGGSPLLVETLLERIRKV